MALCGALYKVYRRKGDPWVHDYSLKGEDVFFYFVEPFSDSAMLSDTYCLKILGSLRFESNYVLPNPFSGIEKQIDEYIDDSRARVFSKEHNWAVTKYVVVRVISDGPSFVCSRCLIDISTIPGQIKNVLAVDEAVPAPRSELPCEIHPVLEVPVLVTRKVSDIENDRNLIVVPDFPTEPLPRVIVCDGPVLAKSLYAGIGSCEWRRVRRFRFHCYSCKCGLEYGTNWHNRDILACALCFDKQQIQFDISAKNSGTCLRCTSSSRCVDCTVHEYKAGLFEERLSKFQKAHHLVLPSGDLVSDVSASLKDLVSTKMLGVSDFGLFAIDFECAKGDPSKVSECGVAYIEPCCAKMVVEHYTLVNKGNIKPDSLFCQSVRITFSQLSDRLKYFSQKFGKFLVFDSSLDKQVCAHLGVFCEFVDVQKVVCGPKSQVSLSKCLADNGVWPRRMHCSVNDAIWTLILCMRAYKFRKISIKPKYFSDFLDSPCSSSFVIQYCSRNILCPGSHHTVMLSSCSFMRRKAKTKIKY